MKIDGKNEISLLHRALLAAKFSNLPENDELAGDPTLAGISNSVYDELGKYRDKEILNTAAYEELRRVKTAGAWRGQWRTAVMSARRDPVFMSAEHNDRISMAKCYLSPFTCTEGELRAFLDDVDGKTGDHDLGKVFKQHSFESAMLLGMSYNMSAKQAHIVFMLLSRKVCDIYLSGVKKFDVSDPDTAGSGVPDMPVVKRISASSGKTHKIDAAFDTKHGKMTLLAESFGVDYWVG